jgi:hypothetical protein
VKDSEQSGAISETGKNIKREMDRYQSKMKLGGEETPPPAGVTLQGLRNSSSGSLNCICSLREFIWSNDGGCCYYDYLSDAQNYDDL